MSLSLARFSVVLGFALMLSGGGAMLHAQSPGNAQSPDYIPPLDKTLYKDGLTAYEAARFDRAYVLWKPLAENGYAPAQFSLGKLFDEGGGPIRANPFMAALWYRQAAAQDVPSAQNNLASMYAKGRRVPLDEVRAVELWEQAAANGHVAAKFNLALSYFNGDGVPADRNVAVTWFHHAAADGVADAQFALGQLYRQGVGVSQDLGLARGWYEKAAAQGHAQARSEFDRLDGVEPRFEEVPASLPREEAELEEASTLATDATDAADATDATDAAPPPPAEAGPSDTASSETAEPAELAVAEASPAEDQVMDVPAQVEAPVSPDTIASEEGADVTSEVRAEAAGGDRDAALEEGAVPEAAPQDDVIAALIEEQVAPEEQSASSWAPSVPRRKPQLAVAATSSADDPPAEAQRLVEDPPSGTYSVWLATTSKQAEAEDFWDLAADSYPDIFQGVEGIIRRVDLGAFGVNYRLQAGPLESLEKGQEICRRLRSEQAEAFCMVRDD